MITFVYDVLFDAGTPEDCGDIRELDISADLSFDEESGSITCREFTVTDRGEDISSMFNTSDIVTFYEEWASDQ